MGPFQELPLRARVGLGAMTIIGYLAFPKAPVSLEILSQIVLCHFKATRWGVLPVCRDAVCVFTSSSRLGTRATMFTFKLINYERYEPLIVQTISFLLQRGFWHKNNPQNLVCHLNNEYKPKKKKKISQCFIWRTI